MEFKKSENNIEHMSECNLLIPLRMGSARGKIRAQYRCVTKSFVSRNSFSNQLKNNFIIQINDK